MTAISGSGSFSLQPGTYTISAGDTNNLGGTATAADWEPSSTLTTISMKALKERYFMVRSQLLPVLFGLTASCCLASPFHGSPCRIPGVVEAEDFDTGDADAAYHDLTAPNEGADYRGATQVDIERRSDASNGHGLGWTRAGEWVQYTVDVSEAGSYVLEIPVASAKAGGRFHIEFDGKDVTGPIEIPDTGGWTKLQTIKKEGVRLSRGMAIMKVIMDADGASGGVGDMDCFRFSGPAQLAPRPSAK